MYMFVIVCPCLKVDVYVDECFFMWTNLDGVKFNELTNINLEIQRTNELWIHLEIQQTKELCIHLEIQQTKELCIKFNEVHLDMFVIVCPCLKVDVYVDE